MAFLLRLSRWPTRSFLLAHTGQLKMRTITTSLDKVQLSPEQKDVLDRILTGRNIFYTGAAGTGKSRVLQEAVKELERRNKMVHVVAPTGRAAHQVKGITIWSYAGWRPRSLQSSLATLRTNATRMPHISRLASTDVLILEEISMMENHQVERLNEVMQQAKAEMKRILLNDERMRLNKRTASLEERKDIKAKEDAELLAAKKIEKLPFGGCQIIATGDFFQLPPVKPFQNCMECGLPLEQRQNGTQSEYYCRGGHGSWEDADKWAFQSDIWDNAEFDHIELRQVYRQKGDTRFIEMLHRLRLGLLTLKDVELLADSSRPLQNMEKAVRLYPTRAEVSEYNSRKLLELATPPHGFTAQDGFRWNRKAHPHLAHYSQQSSDGILAGLKSYSFEPFLCLKKGMPVILLRNLDISKGLINGSQGIITGFKPVSAADILGRCKYRFDDLDYVDWFCRSQFVEYAKSGRLSHVPEVEFEGAKTSKTRQIIWPTISLQVFQVVPPHGRDKETVKKIDQNPSIITRVQIPLIAGWAVSIHRSQGLTLNRAIVNLTKIFEEGQAYVALSRVKSLDGLGVEGDARRLLLAQRGNKEVLNFYAEKFGCMGRINEQ